MSLRTLPAARAPARPAGFNWDAPSDALSRWAAHPLAAEADDPATISIYDVIGADYWSEDGGFTTRRLAGALRAIGPRDVTVAINSPGGDMFEGIAIYNTLREHPAKVTVKVLGYAASAASLVAMAGDEILMGIGSQMMIHKAWGLVVGNDDDFSAAATVFGTFNRGMAEIYSARTGQSEAEVMALLKGDGPGADGTWMTAGEAVAAGYADGLTTDQTPAASGQARADLSARRRIDSLLAQQGLPRSERRRLLRDFSGMPGAAGGTTPRAGDAELAAGVRSLIDLFRS